MHPTVNTGVAVESAESREMLTGEQPQEEEKDVTLPKISKAVDIPVQL